VQGKGLGFLPAFIHQENALKGLDPYQQTMYVENPDDITVKVEFSCEGDIESWVSFYDYSNTSNMIDHIFLTADSYKPILLKINIPIDAQSRLYTGNIIASVKTVSDNSTEGSSSSVELAIPVPVSINVTGEQDLNLTVIDIKAEEQEINRPLTITINFENNGNVVADPTADILITKDDMYIDKLTTKDQNYKVIRPGEIGRYQIIWDTIGKISGKYNAFVNITLDDEVIKQENITLELFPPGTFTKNGTLKEITYDGELKKDSLLKIVAVYINTGEVDTSAIFYGEIYYNGKLLEPLKSPEVTVKKYKQKAFIVYFSPPEDGEYLIKGYVVYDGEESNTVELKLNIGGGAFGINTLIDPLAQNPGLTLLLFVLIILVGLLVLQKRDIIDIKPHINTTAKKIRSFKIKHEDNQRKKNDNTIKQESTQAKNQKKKKYIKFGKKKKTNTAKKHSVSEEVDKIINTKNK